MGGGGGGLFKKRRLFTKSVECACTSCDVVRAYSAPVPGTRSGHFGATLYLKQKTFLH